MKDIAAVVVAALFLLGAWASLAFYRSQGKRQPIAYNHKKHIDAGLECANCHTGIAEGAVHARLPGIEICLNCHASDDNPKTKPIRDFAAENKPIPWKRVYRVPEHVYFSHRRHVAIAKLDCAVCHGDMTKKETPVTRQAVPIRMGRCIECHRRRKVTNDCLACHR